MHFQSKQSQCQSKTLHAYLSEWLGGQILLMCYNFTNLNEEPIFSNSDVKPREDNTGQ
jgi:hypothetical protein